MWRFLLGQRLLQLLPPCPDNIEICYENTWTPEFIPGDVNDDGEVTIKDVTTLIDYLLGSDVTINELAADVKTDSEITIADVTALIDMLLGAN